jgi:hypothetical protein
MYRATSHKDVQSTWIDERPSLFFLTILSLVFLQFCGRSVNRVKACVGLSSSFLHFLDRLVVLSYYHAGLRRNENDE